MMTRRDSSCGAVCAAAQQTPPPQSCPTSTSCTAGTEQAAKPAQEGGYGLHAMTGKGQRRLGGSSLPACQLRCAAPSVQPAAAPSPPAPHLLLLVPLQQSLCHRQHIASEAVQPVGSPPRRLAGLAIPPQVDGNNLVLIPAAGRAAGVSRAGERGHGESRARQARGSLQAAAGSVAQGRLKPSSCDQFLPARSTYPGLTAPRPCFQRHHLTAPT
jgi:hypothetical protein